MTILILFCLLKSNYRKEKTISLEDVETYIKMAHAWLDDEDAKEHKLWKYFVEY